MTILFLLKMFLSFQDACLAASVGLAQEGPCGWPYLAGALLFSALYVAATPAQQDQQGVIGFSSNESSAVSLGEKGKSLAALV